MRLFDAHCHLQDKRILPDLAAILRRARSAGVEAASCCGTREDDWTAVRGVCRSNPGIVPSFGLHPWHVAGRSPRWLADLEAVLRDTPDAGVGEIGLDRAIEEADAAGQEEAFRAQLELAARLGRPVSIHCRRAWDALPGMLSESGPLPRGFVIHSFSGSAGLIPALADMGGYFSFSGSITRSGNKRGHKALAATPADRLLLETDSPDLLPLLPGAPAENPGSVNEPANLRLVLECAAGILGENPGVLAERTWNNAARLFGRG